VHFDSFLIVLRSGDSSRAYQIGFQDPATTTMEGIYLFNLHLLAIIIGIVLLVFWLLCVILRNFTELTVSYSTNFTHNNIIEII
jgi:heme/copper-type cytochrome/quinol oxidase subunit 2